MILKAASTVGAFFGGCAFCHVLSQYFHLNSVLAACIVGFLGCLLFYRYHPLQAAVYSGSFAGMSSVEVLENFTSCLCVGLVGGILLVLLSGKAQGFGGKLGGIAFISVCFLVILKRLL